MSAPDRRAKLDRDHPHLSLRRQCAMLGIARSGVYRSAGAANDNDLALLRRIDELFTRWPFLGSRRMTAMLRAEGVSINRKRVQRLMRRMGIAALGPKPRTTKPAPGHTIYPYLLRDMVIDRVEPGLGSRHHLRPNRARLSLPRGDHGLGKPSGAGVALVEQYGRHVLRLGFGGGVGAVRPAGDLQYRSRQSIHQCRVHRRADDRRHPHLHGRARPLDGQRIHRAPVAITQARRRLPEGLCRRARCQGGDRRMDRVL